MRLGDSNCIAFRDRSEDRRKGELLLPPHGFGPRDQRCDRSLIGVIQTN